MVDICSSISIKAIITILLKAVPIESYITLGYSEEEAEALNKLDPELQHVITQYEISEDSYALATMKE